METKLAKKIADHLGELALPKKIVPSIVHGDLRLENIILDDFGKIASVVDWENCFLGYPEFDLAITENALGAYHGNFAGFFLNAYQTAGGKISGQYFSTRNAYFLLKLCRFFALVGRQKKKAFESRKIIETLKRIAYSGNRQRLQHSN